jgi:hypothetical protein
VIPSASVSEVTVVEDVLHRINGLRPRQLKLFGTYLPGCPVVGTFVNGRHRPVFAAAHRDQPPGIRISLAGARYGQLLTVVLTRRASGSG